MLRARHPENLVQCPRNGISSLMQTRQRSNFFATGQQNKTLLPSVVLFWYHLDSQPSAEPHCGTHHKKALPGLGRNISLTLQGRIKALRVIPETKAGTAAELRCSRESQGLNTKSPFIHVHSGPYISEIQHLKTRSYLLYCFCLRKSRTSLCPVASACK